jgi:hypothetical protein
MRRDETARKRVCLSIQSWTVGMNSTNCGSNYFLFISFLSTTFCIGSSFFDVQATVLIVFNVHSTTCLFLPLRRRFNARNLTMLSTTLNLVREFIIISLIAVQFEFATAECLPGCEVSLSTTLIPISGTHVAARA